MAGSASFNNLGQGLKVCKPGLQEAVAVSLRMDEKGYLRPLKHSKKLHEY